MQQRVVQLAQHALMQHGDLIAKVCGKLQNMCGKYDDMLVLDLAQKLFYFQRDHYVKGGERFVQQNNGRPRDEKAQHLHLSYRGSIP